MSARCPAPVDNGRGVAAFRRTLVGSLGEGRNMRGVIRRLRNDRGDVPGWVLITLMTAGLVIIIWGLAGPALTQVFQQAIDRVTGF